jgi:hypothetical protein
MLITKISSLTGKKHTMDIPCTQAQLDAYTSGMHIQKAMPLVHPNYREFIMTGITPEEWDAEFKSDENEE